jgi:hypothetical protein
MTTKYIIDNLDGSLTEQVIYGGLSADTFSATTLYGDGSNLTGVGGGGISGTQYIFVQANGTDTQNATELQNVYTTAQSMSPSISNRITIVAAPGNYNFGVSAFTMDTQYIDLVSLDGNRSIIFNSSNSGGTISVTANDVFIKGVDVLTKNFTIATNLNLLKVENCNGGDYSFGGDLSGGIVVINVSGTFISCEGGEYSFAGGSNPASGVFTNCTAGNYSFGSLGGASGNFTNCKGGDYSFAGDGANASGTFTNCNGGDYSFGTTGGQASGRFVNCTGGLSSFGGGGTANGVFINCQGSDQGSFGGLGGTASGTFTNCTGTQESFGGGGTASGTFTNCTGGLTSFGGGGTLSGKLYYCRLTSGTFQTVSGSGVTRLCIDGSNVENNQG